jgi:hypothetical protein
MKVQSPPDPRHLPPVRLMAVIVTASLLVRQVRAKADYVNNLHWPVPKPLSP